MSILLIIYTVILGPKLKKKSKTLFIFPGQGSFSESTLFDLLTDFPEISNDLQIAEAIIKSKSGKSLASFIFPDPNSKKFEASTHDFEISQCVIYLVGYLTQQIAIKKGIKPEAVCGHSFGEITALAAAGAFSFTDGLRLVCMRTAAIEENSKKGLMLALKIELDRAESLIHFVSHLNLEIATINSPNQIVVSGSADSITQFSEICKKFGIPNTLVKSEYPFHSELMAKAIPAFFQSMKGIRFSIPKIPVFSPFVGRYYTAEDDIAEHLAFHLMKPVFFSSAIEDLMSSGFNTFYEMSGRRILTGVINQSYSSLYGIQAFEVRPNSLTFKEGFERLQSDFVSRPRTAASQTSEFKNINLDQKPTLNLAAKPKDSGISGFTTEESETLNRYAIVGMGCVFPGASSLAEYWSLLRDAKTTFKAPPADLWNPDFFYSSDRRAWDKFYDNVSSSPDLVELTNRDQRFSKEFQASITADENHFIAALQECIAKLNLVSNRSKLYVGHTICFDPQSIHSVIDEFTSCIKYFESNADAEKILAKIVPEAFRTRNFNPNFIPHLSHKRFSNLVSVVFGHEIPVDLVDAACASSLYSIDLGIMEIESGITELAICGGTSSFDPAGKVGFCRLGGSSRTGVHSFQERADGTVFGLGSGFVAIKKLSKALADGDKIHAIVNGVGTSSDGKGKAIYAPNRVGQLKAIENAYRLSGVNPKTIQYIEAHGTGTPLGDLTEFKVLQSFFSDLGAGNSSIGLGSVKGNFGHLGWSAGVAAVIKMALCLENKEFVPQADFEGPSPGLKIDASPFFIQNKCTSWTNKTSLPRRTAINGFGFGGANAHLIMEEYQPSKSYSQLASSAELAADQNLVIVGVGCHFPGEISWKKFGQTFDSKESPPLTFSTELKIDNLKFKIIDRSASVIDKTQILALEAVNDLVNNYPIFENHLSTTGTFWSHHSLLKTEIGLRARVQLDKLSFEFSKSEPLNLLTDVKCLNSRMKTYVQSKFPQPNEDTVPGLLPNIVPGRVANFFNLRGPNYSINSAANSLLRAIQVAHLNLVHSKCTIAFVGGSNFEVPNLLQKLNGLNGISDGAFCIALTTDQIAKKNGFKIIAKIKLVKSETADNVSKISFSQPSLFSSPEIGEILSVLSNDSLKKTKIFEIQMKDPQWKIQIEKNENSKTDEEKRNKFSGIFGLIQKAVEKINDSQEIGSIIFEGRVPIDYPSIQYKIASIDNTDISKIAGSAIISDAGLVFVKCFVSASPVKKLNSPFTFPKVSTANMGPSKFNLSLLNQSFSNIISDGTIHRGFYLPYKDIGLNKDTKIAGLPINLLKNLLEFISEFVFDIETINFSKKLTPNSVADNGPVEILIAENGKCWINQKNETLITIEGSKRLESAE